MTYDNWYVDILYYCICAQEKTGTSPDATTANGQSAPFKSPLEKRYAQHQHRAQPLRILGPIRLPDLWYDLDRPEDGADGAAYVLGDRIGVRHCCGVGARFAIMGILSVE